MMLQFRSPKGTGVANKAKRLRQPTSETSSTAATRVKGKGKAKEIMPDEPIETFDDEEYAFENPTDDNDEITEVTVPQKQESHLSRTTYKRGAHVTRTNSASAIAVARPPPVLAESPLSSSRTVNLDPDQLILADFTQWRDDVSFQITSCIYPRLIIGTTDGTQGT